MLNLGVGEIAIICVVALVVLGPKRLPELARGIGKFLREFRRQTEDVRQVVEREFYAMDQELEAAANPALPPAGVQGATDGNPDVPPGALPWPSDAVPSGEGAGEHAFALAAPLAQTELTTKPSLPRLDVDLHSGGESGTAPNLKALDPGPEPQTGPDLPKVQK